MSDTDNRPAIVWIDDECWMWTPLRKRLQEIGRVFEARSISEGLRLIKEHRPFVIVSDAIVPVGEPDAEDPMTSYPIGVLLRGLTESERRRLVVLSVVGLQNLQSKHSSLLSLPKGRYFNKINVDRSWSDVESTLKELVSPSRVGTSRDLMLRSREGQG